MVALVLAGPASCPFPIFVHQRTRTRTHNTSFVFDRPPRRLGQQKTAQGFDGTGRLEKPPVSWQARHPRRSLGWGGKGMKEENKTTIAYVLVRVCSESR